MIEFFKELLTISAISLAIAFVQLVFTGHPGIWLTHFYLRLFQRQFPSSLGLGGLFIVLVLSFLYPFGMIFGYLIGFRLAPALLDLTNLVKWIFAIIIFFLWTLLMFELCYRWALSQAAR
jgi:hypothetical protein